MNTTIHVEVTGRVQRVGFRWFVQEEARRAGLAGWVRNLPSGTVEVVAHGEAAAVERLRALLRDGPPGARVDEVRSLAEVDEPAELPRPFSIRR